MSSAGVWGAAKKVQLLVSLRSSAHTGKPTQGEECDEDQRRHRPGSTPRCPFRKGGFGIKEQALHSPAACLASGSRPAILCNSFWDSYNATPEDAAWHPGNTTHNQSYVSNLCDARTLDTQMQQAIRGDRISLELQKVPGAGAWFVVGFHCVRCSLHCLRSDPRRARWLLR